jgi:hypothetical protein
MLPGPMLGPKPLHGSGPMPEPRRNRPQTGCRWDSPLPAPNGSGNPRVFASQGW